MRVECTCTTDHTEPHEPGCPVLLDNLERSRTDRDPAVSGWQAATEAHMAASTSALGRNLQTALDQLRDEYNAVLAARVAAERERDEFVAAADKLNGEWLDLKTELHAARHDAEHCAAERDAAYVQIRRLTGELLDTCATNWIVARDGGRDCERCEQEIRRGEAYQYLGVDDLRHVHCPRPRKHLDAVKRERDEALAEVSRLRASNQTEATDG